MGLGVTSFLLDTHVLIWWLEGGEKLSAHVRRVLKNRDSPVLVSAVSAWEISIHHSMGKLEAKALLSDFTREIEREGFQELAISSSHAVRAGLLKNVHKDPFDRMLVAQAQLEKLALVSKDAVFDGFTVQRIW